MKELEIAAQEELIHCYISLDLQEICQSER